MRFLLASRRMFAATLGLTLAACLFGSVARADEDASNEAKPPAPKRTQTTAHAVVIVEKQDGDATKTVRIVRGADGKWTLLPSDADDPEAAAHEVRASEVRLVTKDGKVLEFGRDGRVALPGIAIANEEVIVSEDEDAPRWLGLFDTERARPPRRPRASERPRYGPLHTVLRWIVKKETGHELSAETIDAWFTKDDVPLQDLRDMFVEDGWNAAALKRWFRTADDVAPRARRSAPGRQGMRAPGRTRGIGRRARRAPDRGGQWRTGPWWQERLRDARDRRAIVIVLAPDAEGEGLRPVERRGPARRAAPPIDDPRDLRWMRRLRGLEGQGLPPEAFEALRRLLREIPGAVSEDEDDLDVEIEIEEENPAGAALHVLERLLPSVVIEEGNAPAPPKKCDGDCAHCEKDCR